VGPTCQTPHAAPGPRGSTSLPCGCHVPRSSRALKALSGPRVGVPTAPSRPSRPPPARRLAPCAVAPTAHVPTIAVQNRVSRTVVVPPWPPRRSPVAVVPRCHPRAGEPPVSSAVSRAPVSCRRWLAVQRRRAHRARARAMHRVLHGLAELGRARCAGRGQPGPRLAWPWAAPALCDWAEHSFGRVALGLDFIFSEYIQFLANSKNLCRIHLNSENYETNFVGKVLICTRL
jgi:hypothetical protein